MTEAQKKGQALTDAGVSRQGDANGREEIKQDSVPTEKNAIGEFIASSREKFRAIALVGAIALASHLIAYGLESAGVDSFIVGIFRFIEYVAAIGDAIWIVVLIVREVCNAITEMLTGRFKMIVFGALLFASGAVLSPHLRGGLLIMLRKIGDLLGS